MSQQNEENRRHAVGFDASPRFVAASSTMTLSIKNMSQRCIWFALLFCTFYDSYRYPLQINSAGTSPTYANTPASFQLAKFLVVLVFCLVSISYLPSRLLSKAKWYFVGLSTSLSLYALARGLLSTSGDGPRYIDVAFWPMAALTLALSAGNISLDSLNKYLKLTFWMTLASNAVQVFLFLRYGRLPALAYANSISVRFGGFLDDPNGISALIYMLMGWAYYYYSGRKRFFAETALVICLFLTQSFTALGLLAVLLVVLTVYNLVTKPRPLLIFGVATVLAAAVIPLWTRLEKITLLIFALKNGSISDHTSQFSAPVGRTTLDLLSGGTAYSAVESWWFGSLLNLGVIWSLLSALVVLILIVSAWRNFQRAKKIDELAFSAGLLMLALYFGLGNINLPLFTVFPVNFIFFLLSYLVFLGRIRGSRVPDLVPSSATGEIAATHS